MCRPLRSLQTPAAVLSLLLLGLVRADLPIHCTQQDVSGEWTFRLGPGEPVKHRIPNCGHSTPNTVAAMLDINRSQVVPPSSETHFSVMLTEEIIEEPTRHLKATSKGAADGMWTMVFDTGLEVRVEGKSLIAHFLFEEMPNITRDAQNGDNWEEIGKFYGRMPTDIRPKGETYACYCDMTAVGWWHKRTEDGELMGGCMWGSKKGREPPAPSSNLGMGPAPPSALVRLHDVPPKSLKPVAAPLKALRAPAAAGSFALGSASDILTNVEARQGDMVKEIVWIGNKTAGSTANSANSTHQPQASLSLRGIKMHTPVLADSTPLPKVFDWRTELASMVPPGEDPLGAQIDQGPCGSCYAFAGIIMLQMRFRVKMYQEHGILYPLELSYKTPTRCSPYTEGCSGGFSYFIARVAQEAGVPTEDCDRNVSAGSLDTTCDYQCYQNNSQIFYAKDYWHVGGFSHGSSEESIMREIYLNGPIELGFATTAMPEFIALSGQSHIPEQTDVMTVAVNNKALKEQYSQNPDIHRWWYSTHAILCVGWGEDQVNWGMVKFWTVRNSWGRHWGQGGYAKMRRGNNDAGVETDASMVMPDMDRLPAGFLEKAKAYHESMAAQRKTWAATANPLAQSGPKPKAGIPEYCKQRPDSPDCK